MVCRKGDLRMMKMKNKLVLVLATLMCIALCACGGTENTSGNNTNTETEEKGFTPNQPIETTEQKNTETQQEVVNTSDMTVEEMQKYYDVEKFVGTPNVITMNFIYFKEKDAYGFMELGDNILARGRMYVEYNENLKVGQHYNCIVCDNNTPDDLKDDVIAYIFTTPVE